MRVEHPLCPRHCDRTFLVVTNMEITNQLSHSHVKSTRNTQVEGLKGAHRLHLWQWRDRNYKEVLRVWRREGSSAFPSSSTHEGQSSTESGQGTGEWREVWSLDGRQMFYKYLFIYLAALGLSCGTRDLDHVMQDLSLSCGLLSSCGAWAPEHVGLVASQPVGS